MKLDFARATVLGFLTISAPAALHAQNIVPAEKTASRPYPLPPALQEGERIRGVVITSYRGHIESMIVGHKGHEYEVIARDPGIKSEEPFLRILRFTFTQGAAPVVSAKLFSEIVKLTIGILENGSYDNSGGYSSAAMLKSLRIHNGTQAAPVAKAREVPFDKEAWARNARVICIAPCFRNKPVQ